MRVCHVQLCVRVCVHVRECVCVCMHACVHHRSDLHTHTHACTTHIMHSIILFEVASGIHNKMKFSFEL